MDKQQMLKNFYLKTSSPIFKRTLSECEQVAGSNVNVLILGEPGTGKETIARYIHACSHRVSEPFTSVNCLAYSGDALQDELFGHEFNSLSGLQNTKPGKLASVGSGTLFLEEVLDADMMTQLRLLSSIESKTFEPLGTLAKSSLACRLISSTSKDFSKKIIGDNINEGFYYRISTICIRIPALRERKEDLVDLIQFFLDKAQKENDIRIDTIEDKAWQFLTNYEYPGNIWELENTLSRMVVLSSNHTITGEGIPILFNLKREVKKDVGMELPDSVLTWKEFKAVSEKKFLESVLMSMGWNISATAKKLNMSSRQIFNKINEYNIEKPVL
ncbi:MAG: sigma 54-interacting transcriptional regulator [Eubacteriales bacterium]|nr:sigma 54-interacting transcriptional regulator [Eubacteriales bacterium]